MKTKLIQKLILIFIISLTISTRAYALDFKTRYAHIEYMSSQAEDFSMVTRIDSIIKKVYEILELKQDLSMIIKVMVYEDVEQVKTVYRENRGKATRDAISFSYPQTATIYTFTSATDNILAHEITHIIIYRATGSMVNNGKIDEIIPWFVEKQFKNER